MSRRKLLSTFGRSQVASVAATLVDFGSLVFLVEVAHVWYVAATAIGACLGAVANFWINRHWSFEASGQAVHGQALRYALVSAGSLVLNSGGVFLLTDYGHLPYPVSKAVIAFLVGIAYNFPMHKGFVFR